MSCHALQRCMERFPGVCPGLVIKGLSRSIRSQDGNYAESLGVISYCQMKDLYRFKTAAGDVGYAVVTSPTGFVVTLLPASGSIKMERGIFALTDSGLQSLDVANA